MYGLATHKNLALGLSTQRIFKTVGSAGSCGEMDNEVGYSKGKASSHFQKLSLNGPSFAPVSLVPLRGSRTMSTQNFAQTLVSRENCRL